MLSLFQKFKTKILKEKFKWKKKIYLCKQQINEELKKKNEWKKAIKRKIIENFKKGINETFIPKQNTQVIQNFKT